MYDYKVQNLRLFRVFDSILIRYFPETGNKSLGERHLADQEMKFV